MTIDSQNQTVQINRKKDKKSIAKMQKQKSEQGAACCGNKGCSIF